MKYCIFSVTLKPTLYILLYIVFYELAYLTCTGGYERKIGQLSGDCKVITPVNEKVEKKISWQFVCFLFFNLCVHFSIIDSWMHRARYRRRPQRGNVAFICHDNVILVAYFHVWFRNCSCNWKKIVHWICQWVSIKLK